MNVLIATSWDRNQITYWEEHGGDAPPPPGIFLQAIRIAQRHIVAYYTNHNHIYLRLSTGHKVSIPIKHLKIQGDAFLDLKSIMVDEEGIANITFASEDTPDHLRRD